MIILLILIIIYNFNIIIIYTYVILIYVRYDITHTHILPMGSLSESNKWSTSLDNLEATLSGFSMADGIGGGVEQLVNVPQ